MPNWVYNRLQYLTHPNIDKVDALEKHIKDQIDSNILDPNFFEFLCPNPAGKDADNWYEWSIENWGTKWDAGDLTNLERDGNDLSFSFNTAWSNPKQLFDFLAEEGWLFKYSYSEEGSNFIGIHTNEYEVCVDVPYGRRNLNRFREQLQENYRDLYEQFDDYIFEMYERLDEEAEDEGSDYESEDDEEEEDKQEEINDNLPITEASRIIAKETPKLIKDYKEKCKHLLANAWKNYLKENAEMYDQNWFAIIGTEKIYKTLNWKWISEQTLAKENDK